MKYFYHTVMHFVSPFLKYKLPSPWCKCKRFIQLLKSEMVAESRPDWVDEVQRPGTERKAETRKPQRQNTGSLIELSLWGRHSGGAECVNWTNKHLHSSWKVSFANIPHSIHDSAPTTWSKSKTCFIVHCTGQSRPFINLVLNLSWHLLFFFFLSFFWSLASAHKILPALNVNLGFMSNTEHL